MSPRGLVEAAVAAGLDLIALCDHNSAENVAATIRAGNRTGGRIAVLAGLEICSLEEVHLLALFAEPDAALDMQRLVYDHLPPKVNRPEIFGEQIVANEDDEVEGFNDRLLIGSTDLDLNALVRAIHERGGLAVASHVDRESYGLLGQLGFIPPDLSLDGLEISKRCVLDDLLALHPELGNWPLLRASDAHVPRDLGSAWTELILETPSLAELALALQEKDGRRIAGRSAPVF